MANFPYIIVVTLVLLYFRIKKRKAEEARKMLDSHKDRAWDKKDNSNHGEVRAESNKGDANRMN